MVSYARFWRRESRSMLPMTREWVAKAESDYDGACEALRSRKRSRRDRICFFSQQCRATPAEQAAEASLYFDDLPDSQMRELNPKYADPPGRLHWGEGIEPRRAPLS